MRLPVAGAALAVALTAGLALAWTVQAADCLSPPTGIVGWWPAEGDAADLVDGFDGTLQSGATADVPGISGNAFQFNGTSAYVSIPNSAALNPANVTVEGWVWFDSLDSTGSGGSSPGQQYIVFKKNSRTSNFEAYSLTKTRQADGDHLQFGVSSAAGLVVEVPSPTLVATGVWYHVAGVRGPDFIQLYVNGSLEGQATVSFPQDYGTRPLFFGSSGESWDHKLAGRLDELALYNRALSAGEIAGIYGAGVAAKCKQPELLTQPEGGARYWGETYVFTSAAAGLPPLVYEWEKDGVILSNATGSELVLANLQTANSGAYSVVVTNPFGSVTSAVANLVVKVADLAVIYSENETQRVAELTIAGVAGQTYGILGSSDPGGTNWMALTNLTLTSATNVWYDARPLEESQWFYRVVEGPIPLPIPPVITLEPKSQVFVTGMNLSLSVQAAGMAPLGYVWFFNGTNIREQAPYSGVSTPTLDISGMTAECAGAYTAVATNVYGAVTSQVATLTLIDCPPLLPGVVGWWPGDGNANDLVGTNHGILRGGATADTNAYIGTGFSFDGTNKYVEIPNAPELNPSELSVECWVRFDNLNAPGTSVYVGQQYLVFKQNSRVGDFEGYVLSKDRTHDDIILWEVSSASGQLVRIDSVSPVTTNVWYHLVGVRGSNYIQLYFNGVLEAQTNTIYPQDYGDHPLYFGTSGQAYWDRRLNGILDEIILYNRALSAEEVAGLYAVGAVGKCKNPRITEQPEGGTYYWGSSLTITSSAVGANPIISQWQKDGAPLPGETNSVLALTNLQPADGGAYVFGAINDYGSALSEPALLNIKLADFVGPPAISGVDGSFGFSLLGTPGQVLGIQTAPDLSSSNAWIGLTNLMLLEGINGWQDSEPATNPARYYRLMPGPIPVP